MASPGSKVAIVIVDKLTITFLVDNCIEWYVVQLRYQHANENSPG